MSGSAGGAVTGARYRGSAWVRSTLALMLVASCGLTACTGGSPKQVVHVLGNWTGNEQASFLAVVGQFEKEHTGITVDYEGSPDSDTVLADRVSNGTPPDLAVLSSPGKLAQYARAGRLTPIGRALPADLATQYSPTWLQLGKVDDTQYAVIVKATLKSLLWYSHKALDAHGWTPPATWAGLRALDQQIGASGTPPWCIGLEASSTSGWPGTDWLEDIVLAQSGPDVYDQWTAGKLAWASPQIRQAWQTWGDVVGTAGMVRGGPRGMVLSSFSAGGTALFADHPGCYFDHEASFITDYYHTAAPSVSAGDYGFVPFPQITPAFSGTEEVAGDLLAMFHATPAARELISYLTTPAAQAIWVHRGGALSPNRLVGASGYPDDVSRRLGKQLTDAVNVRFDASDQMPDAMQNAFYEAVLSYVGDPSQLDAILTDLDRVRAAVYG